MLDSDEELMRRYAGGDAAAFEVLYRRHELRVWRYLERNVRNRAVSDELMQEVWFAVARDAKRYQPTARFTTWLYTIAHNRMIDSARANRRNMSLEEMSGRDSDLPFELADSSPGPLAAAISRDEVKLLTSAISQLPHDQRDAFLLQVEGELSIEEIAEITAVSFETAKSRLRYARTKLRELLPEHA
jgi:RNA polymerase sigma factor (sigma-70 family)